MTNKAPKPVNLWLPDYYKTPVAELFGPGKQFEIYDRTFESAARVITEVFWGGIDAYDPDGVMAEVGQTPTVRVCNHHNLTDPPVVAIGHMKLGANMPYFAAMAELFDERWPAVAERISKLGGYPVDRARMQAREFQALVRFRRASEYILGELYESVAIFPQGGITTAGKKGVIEDINTGALHLAEKAGVPIIVSAVAGNRHVLPKLLFGPRATVFVHEVFMPDNLPTADKLQGSMQIAVQRAEQYHKR